MTQEIEQLVEQFETRKLTRRQLVTSLAASGRTRILAWMDICLYTRTSPERFPSGRQQDSSPFRMTLFSSATFPKHTTWSETPFRY